MLTAELIEEKLSKLETLHLIRTSTINIIKLDKTSYNDYKYIFYGFNLYTKLNFVYMIPRRDKLTLLDIIIKLNSLIKQEFNSSITFLIVNNKKGYGFTDNLV